MQNPFLSGDSATRSLNRARIIDLPGIQIDGRLLGQRYGRILSAKALRTHAELNDLHELDAKLADPVSREKFASVATEYGRRFGFLLLMLWRGDGINRAARPEWGAEHWAFWRRVQQVYAGGGLISGHFGQLAIAAAQTVLQQANCPLQVCRSKFANRIVLVGLARTAPDEMGSVLLLDFGQTSIKRGVATIGPNGVDAIIDMKALPSPCDISVASEQVIATAGLRWQQMLDVIETSWLDSAETKPTSIAIAIASYLSNGHPSPQDQGCFGSLQQFTDHLPTFMADGISRRLGRSINLTLLHDGAAAANAYAGTSNAVVITLGTAIGIGFPPQSTNHKYNP